MNDMESLAEMLEGFLCLADISFNNKNVNPQTYSTGSICDTIDEDC